MKVIADWLELRVRQFDDGTFEAYEALTDDRKEGTWKEVRRWIENELVPDTDEAINNA